MDLIELDYAPKDVLLYEVRVLSPRLPEEFEYLMILIDLQPVKLVPMQDMMNHGL